tara:strand:+ start:412 stop:609 length:198 start_codon:yes stop_codon:yes gene_type:complete
MKPKNQNRDDSAHQFANELMSVFIRWYEESDLDDEEMAVAAGQVIDQFCGTEVDFDSEIPFDEED